MVTQRRYANCKVCQNFEKVGGERPPSCVKNFYKFVRDQIVHEDKLIHQRCSRLLQVNIFLFSAFAVTLLAQVQPAGKEHYALIFVIRLALCSSGVVISLATARSLYAAYSSLFDLTSGWDVFIGTHANYRCCFPQIAGLDRVKSGDDEDHFALRILLQLQKVMSKGYIKDKIIQMARSLNLDGIKQYLSNIGNVRKRKSRAITSSEGQVQSTAIANWSAISWSLLLAGSSVTYLCR